MFKPDFEICLLVADFEKENLKDYIQFFKNH